VDKFSVISRYFLLLVPASLGLRVHGRYRQVEELILHVDPETLNPQPSTPNPESYTLHPKPYTRNPNPKPYT